MHPMATILIADRESKEAQRNNTFTTTTTTRTSPQMRDQAAQTTVLCDVLRAEQAERSTQALAVTVQYLAFEVRIVLVSYYFVLPLVRID